MQLVLKFMMCEMYSNTDRQTDRRQTPDVLSALCYVVLQPVGQPGDEGIEVGTLQHLPQLLIAVGLKGVQVQPQSPREQNRILQGTGMELHRQRHQRIFIVQFCYKMSVRMQEAWIGFYYYSLARVELFSCNFLSKSRSNFFSKSRIIFL